MDILKLASEMDLNCIKAYKLDALKSVRKADEVVGIADGHCEAIETLAKDSDPCHITSDGRATNVVEDSSITTVAQSGKEHADLHSFFNTIFIIM
jgi:hypothetical protein